MGKLFPTGKTSLGRIAMNTNRARIAEPPSGASTSGLSTSGPPTPRSPAALIDQLRDRIRQVETANRITDNEFIRNGCQAIDQLLPERGYPRGSLVQWITAGGAGADLLSLLVARQACQDGGALVVVDPLHQFFPPAAAALGINLDNLIVLQTGNREPAESPLKNPAAFDLQQTSSSDNDLLWAIDQSLRCPAVAAVWGPLEKIDERGSAGFNFQPNQAVAWVCSFNRWPPPANPPGQKSNGWWEPVTRSLIAPRPTCQFLRGARDFRACPRKDMLKLSVFS